MKKKPYPRIIVCFALLFFQSLPLKHCPIIDKLSQNIPFHKRKGYVLASQRTDNEIVEGLQEDYCPKGVCLGDIRNIWFSDVSEDVWVV